MLLLDFLWSLTFIGL